jgi:hypothetical protein
MVLKISGLTKGLEFHGTVEGKRQTYYVFSSAREYFVMSLSAKKRDAGNFNVVRKVSVAHVLKRLRGRQGATARLLFERSRTRRLVPTRFAALNILYILVALGEAKVDARHKSSELFFNVHS